MANGDSKATQRSFFSIYKPGQGKFVRFGTVGAMAIVVLTGAAWLVRGTPLAALSDVPVMGKEVPGLAVQTLVVVIWIALGALFTFWLVNKERFAEFMIMTESEMRKVTWPSRQTVINSTKIVILLTLLLGIMLWFVDVGFIRIFEMAGILKKL
jgi:preprotein translocase subunit SecE